MAYSKLTIGTKHGAYQPYKDHEAMCKVTQKGVGASATVGSRKVTEGRKPQVESANKGKGHGSRGYMTPKLKEAKGSK